MDQKTRDAFYIGAATFMNLESDEVDAILKKAGLDATKDSIRACRQAVQEARPEATAKIRQYGSRR